jgi:proteasome lid subunit RPN8/RPN11
LSPTTAATAPRLAISRRHLEAVERHAAAAYPEECCGFLLGRAGAAAEGLRVERVLPARNEHPESRSSRFLIPPETVLAARREGRRAGLDVVGYYHSHPDHPAEPSEHDRADAWPHVSYLIVPVAGGEPGPPRSWRLREAGGGFEEEAVEALGEPRAPGGRRRRR